MLSGAFRASERSRNTRGRASGRKLDGLGDRLRLWLAFSVEPYLVFALSSPLILPISPVVSLGIQPLP